MPHAAQNDICAISPQKQKIMIHIHQAQKNNLHRQQPLTHLEKSDAL